MNNGIEKNKRTFLKSVTHTEFGEWLLQSKEFTHCVMVCFKDAQLTNFSTSYCIAESYIIFLRS